MSEAAGQRRDGSSSGSATALFASLGDVLLKLPEPERYRQLGAFLTELAGQQETRSRPPSADGDGLGKKLQRLGEEKAQLEDALAQARADLALREKHAEAERTRSQELDRIVAEQRNRLQSAQERITELESNLTAKSEALYEAENRLEAATIKLQRLEKQTGDTARQDRLEDQNRDLARQIETARTELEQLRKDKDAAIEELRGKVVQAGAAQGAESGQLLMQLWDRLARAKPHLATGGAEPPVQAAERLFDAFIELTRFVHEFDLGLRPFLGNMIKHNAALARPWDVYARSPGLLDVVREVIDATAGKPAGVLKMRLMALQRWTLATLIASDTSLESVAPELETQLRGPLGMENDPNRRVRDYLRDDGNHLFQQHMRELRSSKLAEAYAHGQGGAA
ncbi:MAG: hypothetical protein IPM18_04470 [Phycisphaerales bacterium]|nr:hypothetical protein [Phycisphaerales bacterium]